MNEPQVFKYGYNESFKDQVVDTGTSLSSDTCNYFTPIMIIYQTIIPTSESRTNFKKTVAKDLHLFANTLTYFVRD